MCMQLAINTMHLSPHEGNQAIANTLKDVPTLVEILASKYTNMHVCGIFIFK